MPISDMSPIQCRAFEDAMELYSSGNATEAIQNAQKLAESLKLPADKVGVAYHEVLWLIELGRVAEARTRFSEIRFQLESVDRALDSDDRFLLAKLTAMIGFLEARLLLKEGDKSSSIRILDRLDEDATEILLSPGFEEIRNEVRNRRGFFLMESKKYQDALPILESAAPPLGWEALFTHSIGRCCYELKDYERAKTYLWASLELRPSNNWRARSHHLLGLIYFSAREYSKAKGHLEQSLKFGDPGFVREVKAFEWLESTNQALAASRVREGITPDVDAKREIN